jgi:CHAD domain-containing protein
MVLDPKWLTCVSPHDPLSVVARRALLARGQWVAFYLPLAARHWRCEPEFVHQLRVATRRAAATIHLFQDLLPSGPRTRMQSCLKQLRRAAGPPRETDVLIERLPRILEGLPMTQVAELNRALYRHREAAQHDLCRAARKVSLDQFQDLLSQLLEKTHWRKSGREPSWKAEAQRLVGDRQQRWLSARTALQDVQVEPTSLKQFHAFRVEGKRLRYTLELAGSALGRRFPETLHAHLIRLQDRLGDLNDATAAIAQIADWRAQAGTNRLAKAWAHVELHYATQLKRQCRQFQRWWRTEGHLEFETEVP